MSVIDNLIGNRLGQTQERERAGALADNWRACALILVLFIVAATFSALRKDVTRGFDEVAHASYIAHLQHTGNAWPDLNEMRMLDPSSFQFTDERNYLNHPSPYYALLARLGPDLEGHPGAIIVHRLLNIAIAASGLAALVAIALAARWPRLTLYAYVIPLVCIPVLAPIAGSINNDNAAFAGGGIATLAALQLLSGGGRAALIATLGGLIVASWAKLTGLLLVGGMAGGVFAWLLWHRRLSPRSILLITIAALLAVAPYVALFAQYGSPAPDTPGQVAMLTTGAHAAGWDTAARMSPAAYAIYFACAFIVEWMPALEPRNALNYAALLIPVATALCALVGLAISARRVMRGDARATDIVIVAGGAAFAVTLIINCIFSYQRHLTYGWMMDAYPRYYLPLAAIIPLAGLSLLAAVEQPRIRAALVAFLIVGPVVFRFLGGPL